MKPIGAAKTILLVEDEAIIALMERRQLEKDGYQVVHASSGEKAIDFIHTTPDPVDLILMDIDLGNGMDGTAAAERILKERDTPVLFLSSHTEKEMVEKTERITNYGYVVKNSCFTVLSASIKMAFKLFDAQKKLNQINRQYEMSNEELRVSLESLQKTNTLLEFSEDKFAKAFHTNPDSININRLSDGVYVDINQGFTNIMGYSREDVIGRSSLPGELGVWVKAEDRNALLRGLREKGEVVNLEAEFRRKDGSTTVGWMSARIIEMRGEKHILSVTKDMGKWVALERALRDSELKMRTAFSNAPIGISLTGLDGSLNLINSAFCAMLGMTEAEVNDLSFLELTHPDDIALSVERTRALLAGEIETAFFEKRYLHKDGHTVWAAVSTSLLKNDQGKPLSFITYVMEIPERKADAAS